MPLIAEIVLAVSVGCVEIRNSASNQEGYEMDSYQVCPCLPRFCILTSKLEINNLVFNSVGKRPGTITEAVVGSSDQETGIP